MLRPHILIAAFTCITIAGLNSCRSIENTGYLYQTAGAAHDHIMLVRENPPTFGHQRLLALTKRHPDLAVFIQRQGLPRYYAETTNSGDRYFILYYPKKREAFACRNMAKSSHNIEFSGPYPITKNELATLRKLEENIDQALNP
jgi:hypothetical protein